MHQFPERRRPLLTTRRDVKIKIWSAVLLARRAGDFTEPTDRSEDPSDSEKDPSCRFTRLRSAPLRYALLVAKVTEAARGTSRSRIFPPSSLLRARPELLPFVRPTLLLLLLPRNAPNRFAIWRSGTSSTYDDVLGSSRANYTQRFEEAAVETFRNFIVAVTGLGISVIALAKLERNLENLHRSSNVFAAST